MKESIRTDYNKEMKRHILLSLGIVVLILQCCRQKEEETIIVQKQDKTYTPASVRPLLDEWQERCFRFFYDGASPTGLALEGNERGEVITSGGSGFGIMSLIVGIERKWISREEALERMLSIVRFLGQAERFRGMWSHWYNPDATAHPFGDQVKTGDVVESAFLMAGLLCASEYFNAIDTREQEVRDSVASFWKTVDWRFYTAGGNSLKWLWYSQEKRFKLDISGWNEAWIAYVLALAAPDPHNITVEQYNSGWMRNGAYLHPNREFFGYKLPLGPDYGGPLFFAHYSFLGIDPKLVADANLNYWEQNTAHTLINRHYCLREAPKTFRYDEGNWGLTACYGGRPPWKYKARSPQQDDGVIAPTAALSSFPYTPFYSTQVLLSLSKKSWLTGKYGFGDSYCLETQSSEKRHLAIDQGPIVVMMENYRSGLIWKLLMKNEHIQRGLSAAGISAPKHRQGFIRVMPESLSGSYDMMRHPDRERYELEYYCEKAGNTTFEIIDKQNKIISSESQNSQYGENQYSFDHKDIINGKNYTIKMNTPDGKKYSLAVRLR